MLAWENSFLNSFCQKRLLMRNVQILAPCSNSQGQKTTGSISLVCNHKPSAFSVLDGYFCPGKEEPDPLKAEPEVMIKEEPAQMGILK
jgi:hypothetical protein